MPNLITLHCDKCQSPFSRRLTEHNRNLKLGRKPFCSLKCAADLKRIPPDKFNHEGLKANNRLDEYSPFRWHFKNMKQRKRLLEVTLADLKQQWDIQGGRCPYTGWKLRNMETTDHKIQLPKTPDRASLDRIDTSKGYVKGNIQFVSLMAQYAKNEFTDEQVRSFCAAVVGNPAPERSGSQTPRPDPRAPEHSDAQQPPCCLAG